MPAGTLTLGSRIFNDYIWNTGLGGYMTILYQMRRGRRHVHRGKEHQWLRIHSLDIRA